MIGKPKGFSPPYIRPRKSKRVYNMLILTNYKKYIPLRGRFEMSEAEPDICYDIVKVGLGNRELKTYYNIPKHCIQLWNNADSPTRLCYMVFYDIFQNVETTKFLDPETLETINELRRKIRLLAEENVRLRIDEERARSEDKIKAKVRGAAKELGEIKRAAGFGFGEEFIPGGQR